MQSTSKSKREPLFDYLRSICMAFVFFHHFYLTIPGAKDFMNYFNPFAEFFVGIAGFMVGFVYLNRKQDGKLLKRGFKILLAYYSVAIPVEIGLSQVGDNRSPLLETFISVILFQQDSNWVEILILYGIIFMLLPVILPIYRKKKNMVLIGSVILFIGSTLVYNLLDINNFFISYIFMMLLQWQMFFIIGLKIGDLYKNKSLNVKKLLSYSISLGVIALVLQLVWFNPQLLIKTPYSFEKLLNTLYLAPLYLFILISLYKGKLENGYFDNFIRVLGRNSLIAFVLSEYLRFTIFGIFTVVNIKISGILALMISIVLSIVLILIVTLLEKVKNNKKTLTKVNPFIVSEKEG